MNKPIETAVELQPLSVSRKRSFQRCARLHFYEYEMHITPLVTSDALSFGSALHAALEVWWKAPADDRWGAVAQWLKGPVVKRKVLDLDSFQMAHLTALLIGYHARWDREPMEVSAVERKFRLPLVNPATGAASKTFELKGYLDCVATIGGKTMIVEHKSTSEDIGPGSIFWRKLRLDSQNSAYIPAAQACGFDVDGVLMDIVKKTALRPLLATPTESRKYTKDGRLYANQRERDETPEEYRDRILENIAENPDRYYQRCDVVRINSELEDAAADMWMTGQAIREAQRQRRWPRNPEACFHFGTACAFWDVCTGSANINDPTLFKHREE